MRKLTLEHKKKLSKAAKKRASLYLGSTFKKGHFVPIEWRQKLSEKMKGIKPSFETIEKRKIGLKKVARQIAITVSQRWKEGRYKDIIWPISNKSGKETPNWKGGRTTLQQRIRTSSAYLRWRKNIFQRDNYKCFDCERRGGQLQVDHYPTAFSQILNIYNIKTVKNANQCQKFWDTNNGRTLCVDCHKKTDTYAGKINKKR